MGLGRIAFRHLRASVLSEEMVGFGFVVGLLLFVVVSCLSTASTAGTSFDYVLRGTVVPTPVVERQDSAIAGLQRRASRVLLRGTL
jgi:hypothetical protein